MSTEFNALVRLVARLRGPRGCPWDRRQTPKSLKPHVIEEAYEVIEAVDSGNPESLKDELGDLLLQVVFQAQIARESRAFSIRDVLMAIRRKMIRRHPHVFGDGDARTAEEVLAKWETHKRRERAGRERVSLLDGIPASLPALMRAQRMQSRASRAGFDWKSEAPVWKKVREELRELTEARRSQSPRRVADELGDLLFSIVNLARFLDVDAEDSLRRAGDRFRRRFRAVEDRLRRDGKSVSETSAAALDRLWRDVKRRHDLA